MQPVGIASRHDDGPGLNDNIFAAKDIEAEDSADRAIAVLQERGCGCFLEPGNACLNDLLSAQIHEWYAGIALNVRGDATDLAGARDDIAVIVAAKIKSGFLQFVVVILFDPFGAAPRPMLIDQELVVVLNKELSGVSGLLVGVAERAAR